MADDRQCCRWLCAGGAGGGLFAAVLYGHLDMEFVDMTSKTWIGIVVIGLFSFLVSQGRGWGSMLWLLLGVVWLSYCLEKDA